MREVAYQPAAPLNEMEAQLLQAIAEHYQLPALTAQINSCRVTLREYSGCGFFTTLAVPADSPAIPPTPTGTFNGCEIEASELSHGAGSLLFVRDGKLDFLEVYNNFDGDPAVLREFRLLPLRTT